MSEVNETRFLVEHKSREFKCRLNESVCNLKPKWNHDECWWEFKELDYWDFFKKGYILNPTKSDCNCNRACKTHEDLGNETCSCLLAFNLY